jgi:hypothetical protein
MIEDNGCTKLEKYGLIISCKLTVVYYVYESLDVPDGQETVLILSRLQHRWTKKRAENNNRDLRQKKGSDRRMRIFRVS